jgi:hypothetical protein
MKSLKNKQGGFLDIIIAVVIILLVMRYFGLTFTAIFDWLRELLYSVW